MIKQSLWLFFLYNNTQFPFRDSTIYNYIYCTVNNDTKNPNHSKVYRIPNKR